MDRKTDQKISDSEISAGLDCEIVRDLLPLYLDDVCSPKSREAIEEHLEHCGACRRIASDMGVEYQVHITENKEHEAYLEEGEMFRKREKGIRKEVKLSIYDQIVMGDFVIVLLFAVIAAGKFIQIYRMDENVMVSEFMSYFGISAVVVIFGLLLEIFFFIGRYVLKKEMHVTRIWIGWFLGVQMLVLVAVTFFATVIAFSVPAEEILKFFEW